MLKIDPQKTALIIVDIQGDFCSPNGISCKFGATLDHIEKMLPHLHEFHKKIHAAGITTFFTRYITKKEHVPENLKLIRSQSKLFPICVEGTQGSELYSITPFPDDKIIDKQYYDAFASTNLLEELKKRNINTVLISGVWTDMCVDATAKRAFSEGFHVIMLEDLVSTIDERLERHETVLKDFKTYFGFVKSSKAVLSLL